MKRKEWLGIGAGLLIFLLWTMWVMNGKSITFDTEVYNLLQMLPSQCEILFRFITKFGNTLYVIIIAVLSLILFKRWGKFLCFNILLNFLLNNILKAIFQRQRPDFPHLVNAHGYSYPSGHAMIAVALYGFFIYFAYKKIQNTILRNSIIGVLSILMIMIPISRIYLGVHYTSDVIAGVMVSTLYLYVFIHYVKKYL